MNKPTGKLAMSYRTIANMEAKIAELVAASQASLELVGIVTAERDALAAQVKHFRLIFRSENLSQNETAVALQKMASSVDMLPEQCLAAHDAEVAAKAIEGFISDIGYLDGLTPQCIFKQAEEYAAQLRAKAGE